LTLLYFHSRAIILTNFLLVHLVRILTDELQQNLLQQIKMLLLPAVFRRGREGICAWTES